MQNFRLISGVILSAILSGCGGLAPVEDPMRDLITTLEARTEVVTLGDESAGFAVVAPALGAKVLGMSLDGIDGENLLWVNDAIGTDEFWAGDLPDWNAGGWRSWIAPEKFYYLDKANNWTVPSPMDPGKYTPVPATGGAVAYANTFSMTDIDGREYSLTLTRRLQALQEPKGGLPTNLSGPFKTFAVEMTHRLRNNGTAVIGEELYHMGLWALLQVKAAGTCILPIRHVEGIVPFRDYGPDNFETIPPERIHVGSDHISWKFDGQKRGKLGLHPKVARPYAAYLRTSSDPPILMIKQFAVEPEGQYSDFPWDKEYDYGDAVQTYNDGGTFGGFSELECHGPTRPFGQGEEISHTVQLAIYQGSLSDLKKIGEYIMGIDMEGVTYY